MEEFKMKAINIEWDVTDGAEDMTQEEINEILGTLPKEMEIPEELEDEKEILDWISDETGFLFHGVTLIEGKLRYYVCGIGYDENDCVTDYEDEFGDFDTYEEAYECFVKLQCKDAASFFEEAPEIHTLLIQLEECDETETEINCIDVKNEWEILNPKFN